MDSDILFWHNVLLYFYCDVWQAPNDEIFLDDVCTSREFVLRIRFKYPPSLEKQNFSDVWESGAFYYYFLQSRHDFIHDILHDVYHCHIKVSGLPIQSESLCFCWLSDLHVSLIALG